MAVAQPQYRSLTSHESPGCAPVDPRSERKVFEVLLVDDNPHILTTLASVLADSGYRVTTALGGQEALDLLHQKPFDLVLTDLNMPGVDGIAVLRSAKGPGANIKVVVMTASALPSSTLSLIVGEANGFLQKPFSLTELYRTVASCLGTEILNATICRQTSCDSAEALPP